MEFTKPLQEIWKSSNYRKCFGCGLDNRNGLRLNSFWNGKEGLCRWKPKRHHLGIDGFLNGGIIATLIDCHSFWTGLASEYQKEGRLPGQGSAIKMVTGAMSIRYTHPIPIGSEVDLKARLAKKGKRSRVVWCSVMLDGKECAQGDVTLVLVKGGQVS